MGRRKTRQFSDYSDAELRAMTVSELEKLTRIKMGKRRRDGLLAHQETMKIGGRTVVKTFYGHDLIELRRKIDSWVESQDEAARKGATWREAGDCLLEEVSNRSESWRTAVAGRIDDFCAAVSSPYASDMTQRELDNIFRRWSESGEYARDAMRRRVQVVTRLWYWARRRSGDDVIFRDLIFQGLISASVAPARHRDVPSYDVIRTIVTADDEFLLPLLLIFTGARPGEAAALQRSDFDVDAMTVSIKKSVWYEKSSIPHIKSTKTGETREVPLMPMLRDILSDWLESANPSDYLFGGATPCKRGWMERQWRAYWIRRGAKTHHHVTYRDDGTAKSHWTTVDCPCTPYQMRHAYVSYILADAAISSKYRALIAGHSPEIQQAYYDHPVDASEAAARNAVREYGDAFFRNMRDSK